MKRLLLTLGAAALLVTSSLAEENRDGNWWRAQKKAVKTVYVSGMIDGACIGGASLTKSMLAQDDIAIKDLLLTKAISTQIIFTKAEKDSLTKGGPDATLVLVATVKLLVAGENPSARVERLVDGMDQFYSGGGNRVISASYAFYIVDLQISGAPDEEIRRWIQACQRAIKQEEQENK
jgi:hypothetical protein